MTFKTLLPANASPAERALEQVAAEMINSIPMLIRASRNNEECAAELLPWLAWERAVDFWEPSWTEEQKRQVIKDAPYVHRHRGTVGAVRRALGSIGFPTRVVEWFEDSPRSAPYTFRIDVYSDTNISAELYAQIRQMVSSSKNLRSYLRRIDVIANLITGGEFYLAAAATAHIDVTVLPRD